MRKFLMVVGVLVALAIPTVGIAADLNPGQINTDCKSEGMVLWHFVNNQTGGAATGTLTATFSDGEGNEWTETDSNPIKHGPTLHFYVYTSGYANLEGATTGSLPGRLVLSDWCKK